MKESRPFGDQELGVVQPRETEKERLYRLAVDGASDAILTMDVAGRILTANPAVGRIFGYEPDEVIGCNLTVLLPTEFRDTRRLWMGGRPENDAEPVSRTARYPGQRKDGSLVSLEISFGELEEGDDRRLIAVVRDITAEADAERRLAESEERFRDFFEHAPVGFYGLSRDGSITSMNRAGLRMIGFDYTEVIGKMRWSDLIIKEQTALFERHWKHLEVQGEVLDVEYTLTRKNGSEAHVRVSYSARRDGQGRIRSVRATMFDISGERQALVALNNLTNQYRLLFERNLAGVFRGTLDGRVFECNDAYARILGFASRDEFLLLSGRDPAIDTEERAETFRRLSAEKTLSGIELSVRQKDGSPIWVVENLSLIDDDPSRQLIVEGTLFDITGRKLAEERVAYQAYHDGLTGLPNPELFRERFDAAVDSAARTERQVALMFLDLDQFKSVNDTRGHHVGNQLLQLVAYRLQRLLRHEDTVARLGGDEFTMSVSNLRSKDEARIVAEKISAALERPFLLDGRDIYITGSLGIAMYPEDGDGYDLLLRKADIAMYRAKEHGRNRYVFSANAVSEEAIEQMTLEADLRRALDRDEFVLHFQPQVDAGTGEMVAVEALLRWQHPERGMILPDNFVQVAERSHQIVPIGEWVLREACSRATEWQELRPGLRVSVNLSPIQFREPGFDFVLRRVLRDTGLPPELLELEITESAAMQNPEMTLELLNEIKSMGVRISIDDFGTGYSSLSYLGRLPIDSLKIDRGFVHQIESDESQALIISAVIALAHQLNLSVVAEGVETEKQSDFLRQSECEHLQGFLFSRPVPVDDITALLRATTNPGEE
jgi:diguanylate cyclase (GGDEF)-like protein/PAS domain S-box-containing protein